MMLIYRPSSRLGVFFAVSGPSTLLAVVLMLFSKASFNR